MLCRAMCRCLLRSYPRHLPVHAHSVQYVRPTEHPELTAFCTQLTGIEQAQVDGSAGWPV